MLCDYCHNPLPGQVHPYTLRMELYPAIEPSLNFQGGEHKVDVEAEISRLVEIMKSMSDEEVAEQEKLVFTAREYTLCRACRDRIASQIEVPQPENRG